MLQVSELEGTCPRTLHLFESKVKRLINSAYRRSAAQYVSMRHELLIIGELGTTAPIQDHYEDF